MIPHAVMIREPLSSSFRAAPGAASCETFPAATEHAGLSVGALRSLPNSSQTPRVRIFLFRSTQSAQAENLFLRRQVAQFEEREIQPRRIDAATRISLLSLRSQFADGGEARPRFKSARPSLNLRSE